MELLLAVFFRQSFRYSFNRDLKSCQGELDRGVVGHVFSMICWDLLRGLQHPFPAACFVWRPWRFDSNTHDPWNKSGELVFQGSILQVAKFQRANHMQMTMADAVGCS